METTTLSKMVPWACFAAVVFCLGYWTGYRRGIDQAMPEAIAAIQSRQSDDTIEYNPPPEGSIARRLRAMSNTGRGSGPSSDRTPAGSAPAPEAPSAAEAQD